MASYTLRPGTADDISTILDIIQDAFADDPLTPHLHTGTTPEALRQRREKMHAQDFANAALTGAQTVLAVETATGKAVGVAAWEFPVQLSEEQKAQKEAALAAMAPPPRPGAGPTIFGQFFRTQEIMKEKYCDPTRDVYLRMLCVQRSHTRRGIASLLLQDGTQRADGLDANVFLMASTVGLPLYLRQGWEPLDDEFALDMAQFGAPELGTIVHKCLLRRPDVARHGTEVQHGR